HWRPPVLMDGIIPFTAGRTETDNSTLSYDDSSGAYIRQYNNGRNVYFNDQGRHDYTLYPDGRVLSYTYNTDGSIATMNISAPGESTPHWTWNFAYANGKLDSITDPAGRVTDFTVDGNGQLTSVTYPEGSTESFFYNADNLLTQHIDRNGDISSYAFDQYGRVLSDTRPVRAVYDPATGQTTSASETRTFAPSDTAFPLINNSPVGTPLAPAPAVPTTTQLVDSISYGRGSISGLTNRWGNWVERTDASGRTTTYERDRANNVYGLELNGGDCMDASYDNRGNLTSVARIDGAECDQFNPTNAQRVHYTYEERFNKIKSSTDAYGNTTVYTYDYEENLTQIGNLIRIEYPVITDENGLLVTPTQSYAYNALGFVETETDARGTVTRYVYTQGTPDEAASGANPLFAPGVSPVPGLLTQIIENDGGLGPTETLTTTYKEFDALGNSQTVIAPGGLNVTLFLYDNIGRVISQTNAAGITTLSEYNETGNLTRRVTDYTPDGISGRNIVTAFVYDADGRLLQEYTIANGVVAQTSYEYDINGNLAAQTDARGNITRFRYDDANRLVNVIDPAGATITYTHDLNGRVETITDTDGYVNRTVYDSLGRVSAQIRDEVGLSLTTSYTYNLNNNLETTTAPDGTVTCYEYDALNRQTAQVQDCGPGGLNLRTETIYDVNGNPVYTIDERGIVT
ncbi:MAG: RHS repeat protein, partial [Chloroflexi bacterium]|nr:RHS repeat protein [Chloroflexota bacterium]